jgi:hypothetical protein
MDHIYVLDLVITPSHCYYLFKIITFLKCFVFQPISLLTLESRLLHTFLEKMMLSKLWRVSLTQMSPRARLYSSTNNKISTSGERIYEIMFDDLPSCTFLLDAGCLLYEDERRRICIRVDKYP